MKKIKLCGLIITVVVFSPFIVALLLLVLILWLVVSLIEKIVREVRWGIAEATTDKHHRSLLKQLHKTGAPSPEFLVYDYDYWAGYTTHDHVNCTPRDCVSKQAEEYHRLAINCEQEHVPEWRVRWAA